MMIDGKRYQLVVVARTVVLSDGKIAVLFTAWKRQDIEDEIREHFSNMDDVRIFLAARVDDKLEDWPRMELYSGFSMRRHVIPYSVVSHILPVEVSKERFIFLGEGGA